MGHYHRWVERDRQTPKLSGPARPSDRRPSHKPPRRAGAPPTPKPRRPGPPGRPPPAAKPAAAGGVRGGAWSGVGPPAVMPGWPGLEYSHLSRDGEHQSTANTEGLQEQARYEFRTAAP